MHKDRIYLKDIITCINKIEKYVNNLEYHEFCSTNMIQDAVIRNIEIIGEASKKINNIKMFK